MITQKADAINGIRNFFLFDSALLFEHGDLELLDALLYIVFGVVILAYDVGFYAFRILVEVDNVVELRAFYNESSCGAAPVEAGNRDSPLAYLVYAVYIIDVKVSPSVCLNDNSVRSAALSNDCGSSGASDFLFVALRGTEYQNSHQIDSRVLTQQFDQRISEVVKACFFC